MQRRQKCSLRVDLAGLKCQIVKRIGTERSLRYFYYLSRLLTQKLSKNEFDKLCVRLIGKENLSLHNHFICSILKNVCDGKAPPAASAYDPSLPAKSALDEGRKQTGYAGFAKNVSVTWSNGVVSPMKSRSYIRDRKLKDFPSLHVSNGTVAHASHLASAPRNSNGRIITENGEPVSCVYQRPVQKLHEFAEPPICEREASVYQPSKILGIHRLIDREDALHKDGFSRCSIRAPLGIPFCISSIGGSRRPMPAAAGVSNDSSYNDTSLPDTVSLQKRMEKIALDQGLEGVSIESAKILNNGMDLYLKRLITSCVSMVGGGRSGNGYAKHVFQEHQIQSKFPNGFLPINHHNILNNGGPAEALQEHVSFSTISMLDFKVALELNPQQLGEYWPLLLEKITMEKLAEQEL